jgi:ribokinase
MSVCVLGGINWDVVLDVAELPRPGETIAALGDHQSPGGKGLNQAVASARQGVATRLLGALGADAPGAMLRAFIAEAGVGDDVIEAAGLRTGQADICVARDGANTIIVSTGANAAYGAADVARAPIAGDRVFVSQFEATFEATEALFRTDAARAGTRILNTAPAKLEGRHLLALADIVILNETELERFAGSAALTERADIIAAAEQIIGTRQIAIVTLGDDGCLVLHDGERRHLPGHRVPVIDTVGAGDCFVGVLAAALAEGADIVAATARANAAAALAVGVIGAAPAMPSRAEVDAFVARAG